jgi:hypothetical protein
MALYAPDARMERGRLGVMAAGNGTGEFPFADGEFYRSLCLAGQAADIGVFIFAPSLIDWERGLVTGYAHNDPVQRWAKSEYPLPAVVYDRCFPHTRDDYEAYRNVRVKLALTPGIRMLGNALRNKWDIYRMMNRDPLLKRHLPATRLLHTSAALERWLDDAGEAVLKPLDGSQGRGVLHVSKQQAPAMPNRYEITGRDMDNAPIVRKFAGFEPLRGWLRAFAEGRRYLIQRKLALTSNSGEPFDVRALMQKDGGGVWRLTGIAVRCGMPGGLTANLHGGGRAAEPEPFLRERFGRERAGALIDRLSCLAQRIPQVLESYCGRLAELGIDFGIDDSGRIWIIEVNSKPGRAAFAQLGKPLVRKQSIEHPVQYAKYLVCHNAAYSLPTV